MLESYQTEYKEKSRDCNVVSQIKENCVSKEWDDGSVSKTTTVFYNGYFLEENIPTEKDIK
jgi:hypothetical protein